jgi:hypothetical protein
VKGPSTLLTEPRFRYRTLALAVVCVAVVVGLAWLVAVGGPDPRRWPEAIERRGRVRRVRAASRARDGVVATRPLAAVPGRHSSRTPAYGVRISVTPTAIEVDDVPVLAACTDAELKRYVEARTSAEMSDVPFIDDDVLRLRDWKPDRDEARPSDWKESPRALVLQTLNPALERAMSVARQTADALDEPANDTGGARPTGPRPNPFDADYYVDPSAPYAIVLRARMSGSAGSFMVRRGGALDSLPVDRAPGCDSVKLAISARGIEVRVRLASPALRDADRIVAADDGECMTVPRTEHGHDFARLAVVLHAVRPWLLTCPGGWPDRPLEPATLVSATLEVPWSDVASTLAVADDETNGTRFGFPAEQPPVACPEALRLRDLASYFPSVP